MSTGHWLEEIVGDRIAVDRTFHERVQRSPFSNQQWELIMMAVEFEIDQPNDPDRAKIVADASRLPNVASELERLDSEMGMMAGGAVRSEDSGRSAGGPIDWIKNRLGIDRPPGDQVQLDEAVSLAEEYAAELQHRLESRGAWDRVREQAAATTGSDGTRGSRQRDSTNSTEDRP